MDQIITFYCQKYTLHNIDIVILDESKIIDKGDNNDNMPH